MIARLLLIALRALHRRHAGLGQRLEHQFRDRPVRLEVPVDAIGIAATAHHLVGDRGFQVDQRNIVLAGPLGDRRDGARPAVMRLPVCLGDMHRRQRRDDRDTRAG